MAKAADSLDYVTGFNGDMLLKFVGRKEIILTLQQAGELIQQMTEVGEEIVQTEISIRQQAAIEAAEHAADNDDNVIRVDVTRWGRNER